jgi:hypothetical protein
MKMIQRLRLPIVLFSAVLFIAGCGDQPVKPTPAQQGLAASAASHGHGAGPHDGTLADWGGGDYHVEFTVDHDRQEATVYILGGDEKTPEPIKAEKLLLTITDPDFQTDLLPDPMDGEREGASSRFVGTHESLGIVQEYTGIISAEVDGTPYAGNFKEEPHAHEE